LVWNRAEKEGSRGRVSLHSFNQFSIVSGMSGWEGERAVEGGRREIEGEVEREREKDGEIGMCGWVADVGWMVCGLGERRTERTRRGQQ
jgi:hypothetical protein